MIPINDNRPNYRKAITCLTCRNSRDIGRNYIVLECQKHDSWAVEVTHVCDDHPGLPVRTITEDCGMEAVVDEKEDTETKEPTSLEKKQSEVKKTLKKKKTAKRRKMSKAAQKRKRAEKRKTKEESQINLDK